MSFTCYACFSTEVDSLMNREENVSVGEGHDVCSAAASPIHENRELLMERGRERGREGGSGRGGERGREREGVRE